MKRFKDLINESREAPLYHGVGSYYAFYDILQSNMLISKSNNIWDESKQKWIHGISFTRNYDVALNQFGPIVLVLDQRKLTHNYKLVPYDYWAKQNNNLGKAKPFRSDYEYEEYVPNREIKNLSKYLISINITEKDLDFYKNMKEFFFYLKKYEKFINKYIPLKYKKYYKNKNELLDLQKH